MRLLCSGTAKISCFSPCKSSNHPVKNTRPIVFSIPSSNDLLCTKSNGNITVPKTGIKLRILVVKSHLKPVLVKGGFIWKSTQSPSSGRVPKTEDPKHQNWMPLFLRSNPHQYLHPHSHVETWIRDAFILRKVRSFSGITTFTAVEKLSATHQTEMSSSQLTFSNQTYHLKWLAFSHPKYKEDKTCFMKIT